MHFSNNCMHAPYTVATYYLSNHHDRKCLNYLKKDRVPCLAGHAECALGEVCCGQGPDRRSFPVLVMRPLLLVKTQSVAILCMHPDPT